MTAWERDNAAGHSADGAEIERALKDYVCGERTFEGVLAALDRLVAEHGVDATDLRNLLHLKCEETGVPEFVEQSLIERLEAQAAAAPMQEPLHGATAAVDRTLEQADGGVDEDPESELKAMVPVTGTNEQLTTVANGAPTGQELPHLGTVLNHRYELIRCVGAGGSSNVYKALDRRALLFDDPFPYVAVKILNRRYRNRPDWPEALRREASRCQQLQSPNIVKVHDVLRDGPVVYIVMEYLSGAPLTHTIRTEDFTGLPAEQAIEIINAMGRALAYAHTQSIIHCDFKPANVFITQESQVKLIDFGIARMMTDEESASDTTSDPASELFEQHAVTPAYASPELLERGEPDPRDDVFSLACTAYELLTGTHPYDFKPATVAREENLPVQKRRGLTRSQWKALRRALALRRGERTRSIADFLAEFNGIPRIQPLFLRAAAVALTVSGVVWLYTNYQASTALKHYIGEHLASLGTQLKGAGDAEPSATGKDFPAALRSALSRRNGGMEVEETANQSFEETRLQPLNADAESMSESSKGAGTEPVPDTGLVADAKNPEPDSATAEPSPHNDKLARITELLNLAESQVKAEKLTKPANDSALLSYQEVLRLEPGNSIAMTGLNAVRDSLVERFATALKERDTPRAHMVLDEIRSTGSTNESDLGRFREELTAAERRQSPPPRTEALAQTKPSAKTTRAVPEKEPAKMLVLPSIADFATTSGVPDENEGNRDSGLKAIADRLKERAIVKQRQGELMESQALVAEGLRVQPSNGGLQRLREALEHQVQSQAARKVEPERYAVEATIEPSRAREKPVRPVSGGNLNFGTF